MIDFEELEDIQEPMVRLLVKYATLMLLIAYDMCLNDFLKTFDSVCLPIGGSPPGADDDKM